MDKRNMWTLIKKFAFSHLSHIMGLVPEELVEIYKKGWNPSSLMIFRKKCRDSHHGIWVEPPAKYLELVPKISYYNRGFWDFLFVNFLYLWQI